MIILLFSFLLLLTAMLNGGTQAAEERKDLLYNIDMCFSTYCFMELNNQVTKDNFRSEPCQYPYWKLELANPESFKEMKMLDEEYQSAYFLVNLKYNGKEKKWQWVRAGTFWESLHRENNQVTYYGSGNVHFEGFGHRSFHFLCMKEKLVLPLWAIILLVCIIVLLLLIAILLVAFVKKRSNTKTNKGKVVLKGSRKYNHSRDTMGDDDDKYDLEGGDNDDDNDYYEDDGYAADVDDFERMARKSDGIEDLKVDSISEMINKHRRSNQANNNIHNNIDNNNNSNNNENKYNTDSKDTTQKGCDDQVYSEIERNFEKNPRISRIDDSVGNAVANKKKSGNGGDDVGGNNKDDDGDGGDDNDVGVGGGKPKVDKKVSLSVGKNVEEIEKMIKKENNEVEINNLKYIKNTTECKDIVPGYDNVTKNYDVKVEEKQETNIYAEVLKGNSIKNNDNGDAADNGCGQLIYADLDWENKPPQS